MGGRAVHDGSLVASGEWRELPLFGSQRRCVGCAVSGLGLASRREVATNPNNNPTALTLALTLALARCVGCAACPATAALVEGSIPAAFDLAMAGGGETLFSKPNSSPSPTLILTLTLNLALTLTLTTAPPRPRRRRT